MDSKGLVLGVTGLVLGVTGLAFSIFVALYYYNVGSAVDFYLIVFGALAPIPCAAIGLPLSGAAFYQSRESGTLWGIPIAIAGLVTGVAAIVSSSWLGGWPLWAVMEFFDWAPHWAR